MKKFTQISAFLSLLAILFFLGSCEKPGTEFSKEPKIAYKGYSLTKDPQGNYTLKLGIDFTDGDGDIGLSESDSLVPYHDSGQYYFNLHAQYFENINGEFRQITTSFPFEGGDTIHYNGRLPILTPNGKEKAVKGDIEYDIAMGAGPKYGSEVKFKVFIYDRALHKSNEIETPPIVFP